MPEKASSRSGLDRRTFLEAAGAGAVAITVAGCQGGRNGQGTPTGTSTPGGGGGGGTGPKHGGTLTVGLPNPPKGLNALATSSSYSWAILDYVHGWGTNLDPLKFEVHPSIYTDWEVKNVDSGKPDVFFDVREGLTFNDGKDLTVEDVLFTYNYMLEQEPGRYISTLRPIESVQKADNDRDLHMKLTQPVGTYDTSQIQLPILAKHEWEDVDKFSQYTPGDKTPERPIGAGPGRVTKYEPDTSIEVEFRDDWTLGDLDWMDDFDEIHRGGPFLDSIRFKVYTSETAMNQAFLQGKLDTLYGSARASNVETIKNNEGQEIVEGSDTGYGYLGYNLRRTPFDDLPFRQALSMVWDDVYWTRRLSQGYAAEGDFVVPPAYTAARPDAQGDAELLTDPRSQAFTFRSSQPGVPNYKGVRSFLTGGKVITGKSGTFVGQEYPGSFTGVNASISEPRHDYSFGSVQSSVLKEYGTDKEIRVNGKTIPEITGSPLSYYMYPPQLVPNLTEMDKVYTQNLKDLGIPVERKVLAFNPLLDKVFAKEDFDIFHLGWGDTSPFGVSSMYSIFHSDNADDHSVTGEGHDSKNTSTQLNNATGYGLFDHATADDLISEARRTMETEQRNKLARRAVERIYLDQPYQVYQYDIKQWPIRSDKYSGYVGDIAGPGQSNLDFQVKGALYRSQG